MLNRIEAAEAILEAARKKVGSEAYGSDARRYPTALGATLASIALLHPEPLEGTEPSPQEDTQFDS